MVATPFVRNAVVLNVQSVLEPECHRAYHRQAVIQTRMEKEKTKFEVLKIKLRIDPAADPVPIHLPPTLTSDVSPDIVLGFQDVRILGDQGILFSSILSYFFLHLMHLIVP